PHQINPLSTTTNSPTTPKGEEPLWERKDILKSPSKIIQAGILRKPTAVPQALG
ncbi:hypothetical protein ACN38_g12668, partial [Penicillium nordicum]